MRMGTYCSMCRGHCGELGKGRKEIYILRLVLWWLILRWPNFFRCGLEGFAKLELVVLGCIRLGEISFYYYNSDIYTCGSKDPCLNFHFLAILFLF